MKIIFTSFLVLLLACQQPASKQPPRPDSTAPAKSVRRPDTTTLGGSWILIPVLASDTAAGKAPVLRFDLAKSHFSGNTGCNNMSGTFWYSANDSSLVFSDKFVTTKMACPGYNEKAFLQSLLHTNHYRLHQGTLILFSENNAELSRWSRTKTSIPKTSKA
jgi:heat shock protein HslJ